MRRDEEGGFLRPGTVGTVVSSSVTNVMQTGLCFRLEAPYCSLLPVTR